MSRNYVSHRWVNGDDDSQCVVCGILFTVWCEAVSATRAIDWDCPSVQFTNAISEAYALGHAHGARSGEWVLDGADNAATFRRILTGIDEGDPEILDMFPASPLSGEWADDYTVAMLYGDVEWSEERDETSEIPTSYENGFSEGLFAQVETICRKRLQTVPTALNPGTPVLAHGWSGIAFRVLGGELDGRYRVHMVGDNQPMLLSADELRELGDDDFCHECGQLGCEWTRHLM